MLGEGIFCARGSARRVRRASTSTAPSMLAEQRAELANLVYALQLQSIVVFNQAILNILAIRLTILEADMSSNADSIYIGMKVGLFGCLENTTQVADCVDLKPIDVWGMRYFAETSNAVLSTCFYNPKRQQRMCYQSIDGETWSELDEDSIESVLRGQNTSVARKFGTLVSVRQDRMYRTAINYDL
uniref:Uncharacterized protein n=1 Tax=Romanomermis culicivorax TaxID=13658 RepID=A0A915KL36_ROMCU